MPYIYLSPSIQPYNAYLTQGNEQYYMNLIADAMEPYLIANGIQFNRNTPDTSLRQAIDESNSDTYDLHLALHSNAAPANLAGQLQGTDVYYSPYSAAGEEAASIIAENYKNIYPYPEKVKTIPTTTLAEIRLTNAPAVLIETAYHDNAEDESWLVNNIQTIAKNLVESLTFFFDIPFIDTVAAPKIGYVNTLGGALNLRAKPAFTSSVVALIPDGSEVVVLGEWNGWYVVNYNGNTGYVYSDFITIY